MKIEYPLIPKSNRSLIVGQFWPIVLKNGKYACGRVLDIDSDSRKMFYAGLLDWTSSESELPNFDNIAERKVIEQGSASIETITSLQQAILGCRPLELDRIELEFRVDAQLWSHDTYVIKGCSIIRKSNPKDHKLMKISSTWGCNFINSLAEKHFAQ